MAVPGKELYMLFRKGFLIYTTLLVLLLPGYFTLPGCTEVESDFSNNNLEDPDLKYENGKDNQIMEQKHKYIDSNSPLLDQQVPANLETATLALG